MQDSLRTYVPLSSQEKASLLQHPHQLLLQSLCSAKTQDIAETVTEEKSPVNLFFISYIIVLAKKWFLEAGSLLWAEMFVAEY